MKILALIPARGGSKRLPGKNIRILGGKPMIEWSIESAQGITEICDILVSTDDPEAAGIAVEAGALVPWARPVELATDTATSVDVALHALNWYQRVYGPVDGLLLLQPTSPFRSQEAMMRGIELFVQSGQRPVVGVSPAKPHPMWCFRIESGVLKPFINREGLNLRSQDLPAAYSLNGSFYLISPTDLERYGSLIPDNAAPLLMDSHGESLDIDTEFDWQCAEAWLAGKLSSEK
ncbi:cytidylyltransferase domain-containing protein [Pseudomonadota bacterium]